jgi:hypothetical protein
MNTHKEGALIRKRINTDIEPVLRKSLLYSLLYIGIREISDNDAIHLSKVIRIASIHRVNSLVTNLIWQKNLT